MSTNSINMIYDVTELKEFGTFYAASDLFVVQRRLIDADNLSDRLIIHRLQDDDVPQEVSNLYFTTFFHQDFNIESNKALFYSDTLVAFNRNCISYYKVTSEDENDLRSISQTTIPDEYVFNTPYPNPFNPSVEISFDLPRTSDVKIVVYNVYGQLVEVLVDRQVKAGYHSVTWNTDDASSNLASGMYFVKMEARGFVKSQKIVLMK